MIKPTNTFNNKNYITIKEAAKYLGMSVEGTRNLIKQKNITLFKLSQRKFYIPVEEIEQLLP